MGKEVYSPKGSREISFEIPTELAKEFGKAVRIVIKDPYVVGMPVPMDLLKSDVLAKVKGFELYLVPKE